MVVILLEILMSGMSLNEVEVVLMIELNQFGDLLMEWVQFLW